MPDFEPLLNRWQSAGVLDAEGAARIRAWGTTQTPTTALRAPEAKLESRDSGIAWQGRVALILGGILLASGVILFVSAHWDQLGPAMRFLLVIVMIAAFHL